MAVQFKQGTVNITSGATVGTTFDLVTTFTPQALLIWTTGRSETTDAVGSSDIRWSMGMAVSPTSRRCAAAFTTDAANAEACGKYSHDAAVVVTCDASGAITGAVDINTGGFQSDRIQLVVDDQLPATLEIHWAAWGGLDWAEVGSFQEPASAPLDVDVTVTAGRPDAVLVTSIRSSTAPPNAVNSSSCLLLGMAAHPEGGSVTQACIYGVNDDGSATMEARHMGRNDRFILLENDGVNADVGCEATYTQSQSTGFRVNFSSREFTAHIFFLALKGGGQWHVGESTWPTTGAGTTTITPSFQSIGGLVIAGSGAEETTTTFGSDMSVSVGAWDSVSSRSACCTQEDDGNGACVASSAVEHDAVAIVNTLTDTVSARLDIDSISSTQVTYAADTADGTAHWFAALHVGAGAAAVDIPPKPTVVLDAVHHAASW